MIELFRKSWWTISLRGVFIAIFGVLAIIDVQNQTAPTDGLFNGLTIFLKLGFMFALSGALLLFVGIAFRKKMSNWFVLIITAIPDLVLAIYIFANGKAASAYFGKIMGIWILIVGLAILFAAFRVTKVIRVILIIIASLCLLFGTFVLLNQVTSLFVVYGTISYFTVLLGLVVIALGFAARTVGNNKPIATTNPSVTNAVKP